MSNTDRLISLKFVVWVFSLNWEMYFSIFYLDFEEP